MRRKSIYFVFFLTVVVIFLGIGKVTNADVIETAESPDFLNYPQVLKFKDNRNSHPEITTNDGQSLEGEFKKDKDPLKFGSDEVFTLLIQEKGKDSVLTNLTVKYKDVATEIETGRSLDLTINLTNFHSTLLDYPFAGSYLYIYSNVKDNFSLENITELKQSITFTYTDDQKEYPGNFYLTTGSLNFQKMTADTESPGASRYEYSKPFKDDKLIKTFISKDSEIGSTMQPISGNPEPAFDIKYAYMGRLDKVETPGYNDGELSTYSKLGVTYYVKNGFSFYVGTSGSGGEKAPLKNPLGGPTKESNFISATYNHAIVSFETAIPILSFKLNLLKQDNFNNVPLQGVVFSLTDTTSKKVNTISTQADGTLSFEKLIPGRQYTLREEQALEGYIGTGKTWTISVPKTAPTKDQKDSQLTIVDDETNQIVDTKQGSLTGLNDFILEPSFNDSSRTYQYSVTIRNIRKGLLPQTGGSGNTFYYTVAIVSVITAAVMYSWTVYRSRKDWN